MTVLTCCNNSCPQSESISQDILNWASICTNFSLNYCSLYRNSDKLPITKYLSPITNNQLPITNCRLPITNNRLSKARKGGCMAVMSRSWISETIILTASKTFSAAWRILLRKWICSQLQREDAWLPGMVVEQQAVRRKHGCNVWWNLIKQNGQDRKLRKWFTQEIFLSQLQFFFFLTKCCLLVL